MKKVKIKPKQPNRISRNIKKEILYLKSSRTYKSNRSAYLISDSKGRDLKFLKEKKYLKFFYKGGAEINNREIQQYARHQVTNRQNKYPVILFWFGTCTFTAKNSEGTPATLSRLTSLFRVFIVNTQV